MSSGLIYAIGTREVSLVKIGSTTRSIQERLHGLQTGQPFTLYLIASVPVEKQVLIIEKRIHKFLASYSYRGRSEWFNMPIDLAMLERLVLRAIDSELLRHETVPALESMREIPREQMNIVIMRERVKKGLQEIARALGVPVSTLTIGVPY